MAESQEKTPRGPGLVVRLTADEREAWHAAARSAGYRQTAAWVRAIIAARLAAGASTRAASKNLVPAEVLGQLGRIGGNVNQLAHRANAAALNSEPFPVTVVELEAIRRELSAVREALDGDRDVLAQGEREEIEARVRAEVLAEVEAKRQRTLEEFAARGRASRGRREAASGGPASGGGELLERLARVQRRLEQLDEGDEL